MLAHQYAPVYKLDVYQYIKGPCTLSPKISYAFFRILQSVACQNTSKMLATDAFCFSDVLP